MPDCTFSSWIFLFLGLLYVVRNCYVIVVRRFILVFLSLFFYLTFIISRIFVSLLQKFIIVYLSQYFFFFFVLSWFVSKYENFLLKDSGTKISMTLLKFRMFWFISVSKIIFLIHNGKCNSKFSQTVDSIILENINFNY